VLVLLIFNTLMEYYSVKNFCMTLTGENDGDRMGMVYAGIGWGWGQHVRGWGQHAWGWDGDNFMGMGWGCGCMFNVHPCVNL